MTIATFSLAACGSKQDANEGNFLAALQRDNYLSFDACLGGDNGPVSNWLSMPKEAHAKELDALANAGLITSTSPPMLTDLGKTFTKQVTDYRIQAQLIAYAPYFDAQDQLRGDILQRAQNNASHGTTQEQISNGMMQLTVILAASQLKSDIALGKKNLKADDLCYAKVVPGKIVKWKGPMQRGQHQVVDVTFTRKLDGPLEWIDGPAKWATNDAIKAAFASQLSSNIELAQKEAVQTLKLTSRGWEILSER